MNELSITTLLGILFINCVYLLGKFFFAIIFGLHEKCIFLGYGKHEVLKFRIGELIIYLGLFIPLPFLAKFYNYHLGKKTRIRYEWEYFEKKWFLRLTAIFGGAISSMIASMVIFTVLAYQEVDSYISKKELNKYGIYPSSIAKEKGFEKGDQILTVNTKEYERFEELFDPDVLLSGTTIYQIKRSNDTIQLKVDWPETSFSENEFFLSPYVPVKIGSLQEGAPAIVSGLKEGDVILGVEQQSVGCLEELKNELIKYRNDTVSLKFSRQDQPDSTNVYVLSNGMIGFYAESDIKYTLRKKNLIGAIYEGTMQPLALIKSNIRGFSRLLSDEVSSRKNLRGPVKIASLFENPLNRFFRICAILLASIVFLDFMPFPKTSLTKSFPIFIELVFKKKVSFKAFSLLQKVGWFFLILLMLIIIINDIMAF